MAKTLSINYIGQKVDLMFRRADEFTIIGTLKDQNNEVIDLTGVVFSGRIKARNPYGKVIGNLICTILDTVKYRLTFPIAIIATLKLTPPPYSTESLYLWETDLVDSAGKKFPANYGDLKVI